MTTIGRHIPIYDAWSNESGGREIEEWTRYGERKALEQLEAEVARWRSPDRERAWAAFEARQAAVRTAFVEKYGTEALSRADALIKVNRTDDQISLSPFAKEMLADLAKIESTRLMVERGASMRRSIDDMRHISEERLEIHKASMASRQNSYDSRFEKDDNLRADAYERAEAARERLDSLAARSREWLVASARRAGEVAASISSSASLFASAKLFDFQRDGTVRIDDKALADLGPAEAATAELARLIGVLTERNGMGQLRDALIGALKDQNRRIGELTGVAA